MHYIRNLDTQYYPKCVFLDTQVLKSWLKFWPLAALHTLGTHCGTHVHFLKQFVSPAPRGWFLQSVCTKCNHAFRQHNPCRWISYFWNRAHSAKLLPHRGHWGHPGILPPTTFIIHLGGAVLEGIHNFTPPLKVAFEQEVCLNLQSFGPWGNLPLGPP